MATARTEMGRAPPTKPQNKLKAKTLVKIIKIHKSYERERTKSGEKNKTGMGQENATLRQFLIGNEEREENRNRNKSRN